MHAVLPALVTLFALSTIAPALGLAPDEQVKPGDWGFRPLEGRPCPTDPPGFVWRPQDGAASYALQVATDPGFENVVYSVDNLSLYCHCPPRTLGPGTYYWRFRFVSSEGEVSEWSTVRSFSLDASAVEFPMPDREDLLSRIPAQHPRLFVRPEGVAEFRDLAANRLESRWDGIVAECEKLLKSPPDTSEPPKYPPDVKRGVNDDAWRKIWWGNRERVVAVTNGAATLAFAYLLGRDERYAAEARRLILAACEWDPKGATGYRYNDEAGMPFAYYASRTYTWLHGYLSEADREQVRAVMQVRGKEIYDHLSGNRHIWRPYNSHSNRAWHWLGEVATAFHGEIEGTGDWAWFALNVFFNSYPVWNDDAGGWHEGTAYWSSYLTRVTWWLATMKPSYGIDGFRKPFFANAGNFGLYVIPPGETMGGFGDLTMGQTSDKVKPLMSVFARMARNPYWQWYVDNSRGPDLPGGYMGFIYGTTEPVAAKEPTDIPSSVVFPGIGQAVLHSDLANRANDVQFMLKSSPMGTQSHGYESQNAFLLSVAGEPVFIRSGRRDLYGSPHHRDWMWETKSVNSITVNGEGQTRHAALPLGRIAHFATSASFDYVVGEAAEAYQGRLDRFTRAVLFIKPHAIVLFDALRAPEAATFEWLLHSPSQMQVQGQTIVAQGERAGAALQLLHPTDLAITQTNQFTPPPQEWVKLEQWHLQAALQTPTRQADFVSVIRPHFGEQPGPALPAVAEPIEGGWGCEIELPAGRALVAWRRDGEGPLRYKGLRTDGAVACVVLLGDGKTQSSFVHGGEEVGYEG